MFVLKARFLNSFCAIGRTLSSSAGVESVSIKLCNLLNISNYKAESIIIQQPSVAKLSTEHLEKVIETVTELGFNKSELATFPVTFTYLPITLKNRYKILEECGFDKITLETLSKYLRIAKKQSISELKSKGFIPQKKDVAEDLANIFTQWPTSQSPKLMKINEDICTLHVTQMKILQRYLELVIDLPEEDFFKKLKVYVRIKHKPFKIINEMLNLLQHHLLMPSEKIRSNLFLIHAEPENVKKIISTVPSIGGRNIKDIIKQKPKFCTTNADNILAMLKLFNEYGIKDEAQARCIDIFTLSHKTVKNRIELAKTIPAFDVLSQHPRILKLFYNEKTAIERLKILEKTNKKCFSLNILSGSEHHYKIYEKSPGDRYKGVDLLHGICGQLGPGYKLEKLRELMIRHPFWINIPVLQAMSVYKELSSRFSPSDLYENCYVILYPLNKIQKTLQMILGNPALGNENSQVSVPAILNNVRITELTDSQLLGLVVYFIEKDHYFSGNGVWNGQRKIELEQSNVKGSSIQVKS